MILSVDPPSQIVGRDPVTLFVHPPRDRPATGSQLPPPSDG